MQMTGNARLYKMNRNDKDKKEEGKRNDSGCLRPAVAVIGFFAIMFIAAYFAYRFQKLWIIPIGIILMIAWAVYFSMPKGK